MAKTTDKAVYYNSNLDGSVFDILKRNSDGTIDIGLGDSVAVKSCPVSKDAVHGHATIGAEPVNVKKEAAQSAATVAAAAKQVAEERVSE